MDEDLGPAREVAAEHLLRELLEQLLFRPLLGEDHPQVEEEFREVVTSQHLLGVLPGGGARLGRLRAEISDDLRLEDVGGRQVQATGVHDAEDPVCAVEVRSADDDEERPLGEHLSQFQPAFLGHRGEALVEDRRVAENGLLRVGPQGFLLERQQSAHRALRLHVLLEEVRVTAAQSEPRPRGEPTDLGTRLHHQPVEVTA